MGDNNENPTVQEILADKCVQRTMAVGSPRPAVKEHSPNMGTKTMFTVKIVAKCRESCGERTFPKHGDENYKACPVSQTTPDMSRVKEHSPNMGTKTV